MSSETVLPKIYIAGPMSGIPQFNYPAFDKAARTLRALGYDALSPAEMDNEETRSVALASEDGAFHYGDGEAGSCNGETWGDFLARDVKIVSDIADGVYLLPGWENSRGARLEAFIALCVEKPVYLERMFPEPYNKAHLIRKISENVIDQGDTSRYRSTA